MRPPVPGAGGWVSRQRPVWRKIFSMAAAWVRGLRTAMSFIFPPHLGRGAVCAVDAFEAAVFPGAHDVDDAAGDAAVLDET